MPFVRVGDLEVYYEQGGSGPRLLFISGTGGDLRRRPSVFERPIGPHFEILTYDQRGLGRTSKPDRDYTMAEYAEDAIGLLDAVGWDRCHVMGVSFGGMVAQEIAIRYPGRVDRIVMACSSSGGAGNPECPSFCWDWPEQKGGYVEPLAGPAFGYELDEGKIKSCVDLARDRLGLKLHACLHTMLHAHSRCDCHAIRRRSRAPTPPVD